MCFRPAMKFATELVLLSAQQQDKAMIVNLLHCHACLLHTTVMLCIRLSSMSRELVAKPQLVQHAGNGVLAAVPKPAQSRTHHELMTITSEAAAT